jgi:hypothetical protein
MSTPACVCDFPLTALTSGPRAHFFGYYDKSPWDASFRRVLALEADAHDRMPLPGERADVGFVDLDSGRFEKLADTGAWNWQQGCMLQWLPPACDRQIIFNDVIDGEHHAVVLDIHSGARRVLPRPIYNLSRDGAWAVSVSLARLAHTRLIVGYAGVEDPHFDDPHPADDGVWHMDLATGEAKLIVPFDTLARYHPVTSMQGQKHRVEHSTISPDGKRFFMLHRWKRESKGRPFHDRLFTADADGGNLYLLCGDDMVSHFDWRDPQHILAWAAIADGPQHFLLFRDRSDHVEIIGREVLTRDGHCSYSPDRQWVLTDSYPDKEWMQSVILYHVPTGRRVDIGRFFAPRALYQTPGIRCDLHPRWRQDGRAICIDSAHAGPRQMYSIDVRQAIDID